MSYFSQQCDSPHYPPSSTTVVVPEEEPESPIPPLLTLAEMKAHMQVTENGRNAEIEFLGSTAEQHVETITGRSFLTKTFLLTLDRFPPEGVIFLTRSPAIEVEKIEYIDNAGDLVEWDADEYVVDTKSRVGRIMVAHNKTLPQYLATLNAWQITFTAGYGAAASACPPWTKHACQLLVSTWFDMPGAVIPGAELRTVPQPAGFESLIAPHVIR